jgi:hypothetical protein
LDRSPRLLRWLSRYLWRAFWAFMLLLHAPAWWATCGTWITTGDVQLLQSGVLSASLVLFLLKLLDVRWLRLPCNRRAYLGVTVAILLLHGDVARRLAVPDREPDFVTCATIVAGLTAAQLAVFRVRLWGVLHAVRPRAARRRGREALNQLLLRVEQLGLSPRCLLRVCPCPVNRAPPL